MNDYSKYFQYSRISISRILDKSNSRCLEQNNRSHPYQFTQNDKSNSRCLEQIFWSLDSSRYRELTVYIYTTCDIKFMKIMPFFITLKELQTPLTNIDD